jgi:hypothetical protein
MWEVLFMPKEFIFFFSRKVDRSTLLVQARAAVTPTPSSICICLCVFHLHACVSHIQTHTLRGSSQRRHSRCLFCFGQPTTDIRSQDLFVGFRTPNGKIHPKSFIWVLWFVFFLSIKSVRNSRYVVLVCRTVLYLEDFPGSALTLSSLSLEGV